jgi:putative transposase
MALPRPTARLTLAAKLEFSSKDRSRKPGAGHCEDRTMKRKRHTEEQIIAILKEHEAGAKTADVCRKHGISEATFYNWKAKYGGLEVSDEKRLKAVESENARLKKLLADAMLDNAALKDLLAKKW